MRRFLLTLAFGLFTAMAWAQCPPAGPLSTPYTENFDSQTAGYQATFGNCYVGTRTTNPRWEYETSGTANSFGTGPLNDYSGTGLYAYLETSGGILGDTAGLITPAINLSGLTTPELTFYYHMFGINMGNLEVYINSGSGWVKELTIVGQQQTTETSPWNKGIVGLSGYANSTVRIKFLGIRGNGFESDMSIDEIKVDEAPACPQPTNFRVISIGTTTAQVTFNAVSAASSGYKVLTGAPGFNPAVAIPQTSTNDTITITGLSPASFYEAYVVSDCSTNGISDTTGPIAFQTTCVPFNTFYFRNFDLDADGAVPQCWVQYNSYDPINAYARTETVTNAYSGNNVLEMYSYFNYAVGDTLMAVSPEFSDMNSQTRQVKFYASSQTAGNTLIVGTTNSQAPGAPISVLDTITLTTSWQLVIIPINASSGYNGSDKYIVLRHGLENTFSDVYVDDFTYEAIPACPQLTNISLSTVGITTATFTYNSGGNPVQFEYGPVGYLQGTGTVGNISASTGTITGLSNANCYDVYLRTDCTAGGNGTSIWSGPFTVCTLCLTQSLPYSENFDIGLGCFIAQDGGTTPDTWVQVTSTTTTSSPAGLDGSPGWVEADSDNAGSGAITMDEVLISPYIDAGSITGTLYLEFDQFYQNLSSNAIVEVWDGNAWVGLLNQTTTIGAFGSPDHQKIDITSYANDSLQVRFVYKDNGAWAWWWLIDNVLIQEELCARSTNFQAAFTLADSIGLSWNPGSGTVFGIEYGPAGFTPGTGTLLSTTNSSITVSGLTSQTSYDFYLIDSCGSTASIPVFLSATTSCALTSPAVLPLVEDFESYSSGPTFTSADQLCNPSYLWNMLPRANGQFRLQAGANFVRNGLQAMTIDQSAFASNITENDLTMTVDLSGYTSANGITLSFYYQRHTTTSRPGNRVLVRGSAADTWVQIATMNSPTAGSYDSIMGLDIVGPLAQVGQTVSATTQIKFVQSGQSIVFSNTCCDGLTIDDLRLDAVTCPKPGGLSISNLFDTTATLNWTGTASNYQYWFGPAGFYQGTATTSGVKAFSASSGVLIDTLSQFSCYEFLVRSVCGAGDSSNWEGPYQFCTPCSPITAPYFEDWDAYSAAGSKDVGCYGIIEDPSFAATTFSGITIQDFTFYNPISPLNFVEFDNSSVLAPLALVSPPTTDLTAGDKRVEFFARSTFNASPAMSLIVGTFSNGADASTFHPIDTIFPDGSAFTTYIVEFTAANGYNGTDAFYGFMHGQTGTFQTILVDDIMYEKIPTCVRPSGIQQDSADLTLIHLSWTSNGVGNSWEIEYGPVGFAPGTGTSVIANSNPYTLTGLTAATAYDVYVTEICGPGDSSRQVGPVKMSTTVCAASNQCWFSFDLLDSFGDGWNGGLVEVRQNGVAVATLGVGFTTGSLVSDSLLLCDNFNTSIVVTNAGGWPSEMGIVMYTPWGDTAVHYPNSGTTTLNTVMGTFTALCTPPTCTAPSGINQTSAGLTDIGMSFTANGTGGNYEIDYGVPGHLPGAGTIIATTSTTYTITGLSSATNYDVYVREICGPGDTSAWAGPVQMNTTICAASQQCVFNFDLTDSFGDGWNGAEITVYQNGIQIGKLGQGFTTGNLFQDSLSMCDSLPTTIILTTAGGWPSEVGFYVYNPLGDTAAFYLANFITSQGDTMANFIAYCTGSASTPCIAPTGLAATANVSCDAIEVAWTSNTGGSILEYGPAGFTPGSGTTTGVVTPPYMINGLNPGTAYDVYVADTCNGGTSSSIQASVSTASGPVPVASYTSGFTINANSYSLFVDASGSTDANSYEWDFGNGITSTNAADTMVYLGNGVYTVSLIVSNACGSDTITFTVNVNIGLEENPIANSLNVYPNPADRLVTVSFDAVNSANATVRLLDAQGREILSSRERAAAGKFSYKIDVSELASGIYFIEITSGEFSAHRRLSVK